MFTWMKDGSLRCGSVLFCLVSELLIESLQERVRVGHSLSIIVLKLVDILLTLIDVMSWNMET